MTHARRLNHPPIQEAVIDFCLAGQPAPLDVLEQIADSLLTKGGNKVLITTYEAQVGAPQACADEPELDLRNVTNVTTTDEHKGKQLQLPLDRK